MAITDPLLLSPDVLLVPVTTLPREVRRLLDCGDDDWAMTHPRARTPSRIVDARSAALLEEFRQPRTVVDAVIRFSRARDEDPEATLEAAYPLLERLLSSGFLLEEGAAEAAGIRPTLLPGDQVAGFTVLECLQALEDTELYQVRGPGGRAALKIERSLAGAGTTLEREAAVLAHLDGRVTPRLLDAGLVDGRRFLAMEWCSGVDVGIAAAELRPSRHQDGGGALLALCRAIAGAYSALHERGVVHGDVHPRNALVASTGEVRLVDFGMARRLGAPGEDVPARLAAPPRGGIAFFYEPEYARAVLAGRPSPAASPAGEQFAVAALLYFLLTGAHRRDFPLMRDEMLRQIAEAPPLPFAERGVEPWPAVEAVLARALRPEPRRRYRSMAHFTRALAIETTPAPPRPRQFPLAPLLDRWLERVAPGGPLWTAGLPPPRASVHSGAAGIACALYRVALAREDPALLAQADLWAARATSATGEDAFYAAEKEITPEMAGRVSPYYAVTGPLCVRALVAHVQGDTAARQRAVERFVAAAREPCPNPDLTLGRSGVLLAAALLLDTVHTGDNAGLDGAPLLALGNELLDGLWREIAPLPAVPDCAERANLGMAHGWAGILYTTLRWCRTAGVPRPPGLEARLAELAGCALAWGRGLRWPWRDAMEGTDQEEILAMPGWCNGSAGFVYLWTLAGRELGGADWALLAEGAAWNTWEAPDRNGNLCCGLAGRAYALLHLWRHGGGLEWLDRARELADRAAREIGDTSDFPDGLFRGLPGVAALAADLTRPETAAFPLFDEEGWR